MTVIRREPRNGQAVNNASIRRISARSSSSFAGAGRYTPERAIPSRRHCPLIEISGWPRSSIALRSEVLIARTSALKKSSPPSTARSWRAASRSPVRAPRPRRCRRRGRRPAPRSPAAASSRHKSGSDEPRDAPPGPPPSPAPAAPPGRSSPSAPHRSSVSASSSSSPSTTTEPTPLQSSRRSQNRGPLQFVIGDHAFKLSDVVATGSDGASGWRTFVYKVPTNGVFTIGFATLNDRVDGNPSPLYVDNVRLNRLFGGDYVVVDDDPKAGW